MDKQALRRILLTLAVLILLILPVIYLLTAQAPSPTQEPEKVVKKYLKAIYALDYERAYDWISERDQKLKNKTEYLRENAPFSGTALELSRKLAEIIEIFDMRTEIQGKRAFISFTARLPDANAPSLQKLVLDFDPDRLSRLSSEEKRSIVTTLKSMRKDGTLVMLEGEESLELVKEQDRWRISVDWAGAIRVQFNAEVKEELPWEFRPFQKTVMAKPGETLRALYKAKNLSDKAITAKARHRDEPKGLAAKHLQIVQCFCFLQQTLAPGEEMQLPLV
ncbi:MAG: cytochrome c oxidase assembly protein, partial [Candidatus Binatia bacterium]